MGNETFPKIRSTKNLNARNQFGRVTRGKRDDCHACEQIASFRVVVAMSWFPSEDLKLGLCGAHESLARRGEWRELADALEQRQNALNDGQKSGRKK